MAGRPKKKPEYNPELQFNNFLQELRDVYEEADSLRSLADELNISLLKLRKLLITADIFTSDICTQINDLHQSGKKIPEIMKLTGLSRASVHSYLPYTKVTDINRMKIEEQKKAVRSGYDMDIIPSDLNTYGGEAKRLLEDLQSRNERMFLVTVLFLNTAQTKQELENVVFQTAGIAQKYNCALKRLDYQQEPGLMSCLPLGMNLVPIKRALTTTSTAIFVPFTTQELFMGGESIYYGLNALSNNLIMADRKKLKNPNGLILGTPGSGKSFAAKREIANAFIVTSVIHE